MECDRSFFKKAIADPTITKRKCDRSFFKKAIADPTIIKRKCDRDEKISVLVSITSFKNRI